MSFETVCRIGVSPGNTISVPFRNASAQELGVKAARAAGVTTRPSTLHTLPISSAADAVAITFTASGERGRISLAFPTPGPSSCRGVTAHQCWNRPAAPLAVGVPSEYDSQLATEPLPDLVEQRHPVGGEDAVDDHQHLNDLPPGHRYARGPGRTEAPAQLGSPGR